ncbi:MAG: hypothetical protein KKD69_01620 [Euryarchaeota archaeon]|nr:hypothetical protein [Euryarchaeota archaeon]MBU4491144.1 hypothetical protein [Euryarchaeota archaeon]MCG2728619.1 hypothetical protein [Candidatus Methanoperedenaceae archaeon]
MKPVLVLLSLILIALTAGISSAERQWVNNITVEEYDMTWGCTETFTGMDSVLYRGDVDSELGDTDSFITAWELLKLDKEMRKRLRSSIDNEFDVRIETPYLNTGNNGIEVVDVDSALSPAIIGNTSIADTVVNRYNVAYRWKNSIFNASSIWFLGQAKSPVTVILPTGIDVTDVSGMDNVTKNIGAHAEISGFFTQISRDRGEITINFTKNTSVQLPVVNITNVPLNENATKPVADVLSKIRDVSILGAGIVIILLIYVFKVRRR